MKAYSQQSGPLLSMLQVILAVCEEHNFNSINVHMNNVFHRNLCPKWLASVSISIGRFRLQPGRPSLPLQIPL